MHNPDQTSRPGHEGRAIALSILAVAGLVIGLTGGWLGPRLAAGLGAGLPGGWPAGLPLDPGSGLRAAGLGLVYLAGGVPAAVRALHELRHEHRLDIELLMVIAALAAAGVGAPVEGAVLLVLFSVAGTLETLAMGRARREVEALMALRPDRAHLLQPDGSTQEVPVSALVPGDRVMVRPGARIPVDAEIETGEGEIDESSVTGESLPVARGPGAQVFEATVNLHSVLRLRVTRGAADSTVARMIALVTQAQAERAPSERFSDWFGQRYTWAVLGGALVSLAVLLALGHGWHEATYRAAVLLVAASPCAIVISVPAAILSALSAAARGGVLFKGGAALETFAAVRAFAFDKTGTLTTGRAEVTDLAVAPGCDPRAVLADLAGLEAHSEHPLAAAIRRAAEARGIAPSPAEGIAAVPAAGIAGVVGGRRLWAGNRRMARDMGADPACPEAPEMAALADGAHTLIWLGEGPRVLGVVALADRARANAPAALAALRDAGIGRLAMLTGDRPEVAHAVAADLGMDRAEVAAALLPEDKVAHVARLGTTGRVAFVGDGVNDAAALARADVGIAMGAAGSEVALQAADVALLSEDLGQLAAAHRLARRTARVIRQNLILATGAMLVLVVGALWGKLPLPLAVVGHEGGTVLVVLNGLRLLFDPIRRA
ncbi:heavy metal translocating P-type ATPase [Phaeovulum vinaykumarii]|uniref:Heavy metal-(Cd/Co/Hg/Pb/Zn)-translocating P-type ATPase n=1 Tax=Phaeovulum vinaykumarii TaxID=407234 RepID=A0A1N7KBV6_9RHOB|nr:heavy metal translocating P-type ATPase [Phaeovulum vinaykumarii]SIS59098.1 heavy metal-(Cd/Co/Hg/Pb/Zn)-translocating P-type ATPase [Phaeovulum vinaykumarii]SOB94006.1 heavy metal-(Cd/Co/Hg/Pb/Zn)-translocating P-type ATPase [Phaeovulum vinaykumarii]